MNYICIMILDERLKALYICAERKVTAYLDRKCDCNNTLVIVKESGEYDVRSFTANYERNPHHWTTFNAIYQSFKEIHSLDDLKENFEIIRKNFYLIIKEHEIKQQLQELEDEFR